MQSEVRRVAADRLDGAIELLDAILVDRESVDIERAVHDVRKRCKSTRGLARLVEPALGNDFTRFDRRVRKASAQLSSLRDAHAVLGTFDKLAATQTEADTLVTEMRSRQESIAMETALSPDDTERRVERARSLLVDARDASQRWKIARSFDTIETGLAATYRQGRSSLRRAHRDPTDHRLHEWRKAAKYLWYQTQLVHDAAPSVLGPMVDQLDLLGEALGDDHDLAVLVALLDADPTAYGSDRAVARVREVARHRQGVLRDGALRAGATIYAESSHAFAHRVAEYWQLTVGRGPELPIITASPGPVSPSGAEPQRSTIERERRFLVEALPERLDDDDVVELSQGYLATGERGSMRVRDAGTEGCTFTFKAGRGAERTELEWPITRHEFDAAWPYTDGRRIEKQRYRIPHVSGGAAHVIELDVFGGDLEGLVIAEVEFGSSDALAAFEPAEWFGLEVTDDGRYSNASLALHGLPSAI